MLIWIWSFWNLISYTTMIICVWLVDLASKILFCINLHDQIDWTISSGLTWLVIILVIKNLYLDLNQYFYDQLNIDLDQRALLDLDQRLLIELREY